MKRLLITFVCLIGCMQLFANPVTADQARQKAGKFLNDRIASRARARAPQSADMQMASVGAEDSYYIFNIGEDEGFVIVSGEDATEEILGYSDEGHIDPENMAPALKSWMDSYTNHIKYLRKNGVKATTRASFSKKFQLQSARLARYDQRRPYNNKCPFVDSGLENRAVTGCAATAMAQLMYYHVWPLEVIRPIPGYKTDKNITVDPVEKGSRLNWANTLQYYRYNNFWDSWLGTDVPEPTDAQEKSIAEIMLYAGTALYMDYGKDESNASVGSIPYVMQQYFGYQEGALYISKVFVGLDEWLSAIYRNLVEIGPVIYRAENEQKEGHIFICEGVDHDKIYLNWGWDGNSNGWFHVIPETDKEKEEMEFYDAQGAVFNLRPDKDRLFKEAKQRISLLLASFSNDVRTWKRKDSSKDFEGISITAVIANEVPFPMTYDYGIALFNEDGIVGTPNLSYRISDAKPLDDLVAKDQSYSVGKNVPDGKYDLCFVSRKAGSNEIIKAEKADFFAIHVTIQNNTLTVDGESTAENDSHRVGDVNGDNKVNVADIVAINKAKIRGIYNAYADLNGDKKVTQADVEVAVKAIMSQKEPYNEYAVDLGLSVKWAKMNVGADKPEDYGGYYAWAETKEKTSYTWSNYKYSNASGNNISKYCTESYYGKVDGLTTIEPMDDAARVNMGKDWRMPTKAEMDELVKKCTWKTEKLNGVRGFRVTGPNGNSIFLPFGGEKSGTDNYNRGSVGYYWTSTLSDSQAAPGLCMYDGRIEYLNYVRKFGLTIRPVLITSDEMDDPRMDDIIPDDMRERLKDHMPIYNGINPPNIEGAYYAHPYTAVYCEDGKYAPGRVIDSYKVKFSNQNSLNNTIDMSDYNVKNVKNYDVGSGAFISGHGEYFTAFFATEGYTKGIHNKMAVVISGRRTSEGIRDYYYGLLMVEKDNDPNRKLMDIGYYRVFKDGDGLSEPTTWNLNVGARGFSPESYDSLGTAVDGGGK